MVGSDLVAFIEDKHPMWLMLYRAKDLLRPGSARLWDKLFLEDLRSAMKKALHSPRCCTTHLPEGHRKPTAHYRRATLAGGRPMGVYSSSHSSELQQFLPASLPPSLVLEMGSEPCIHEIRSLSCSALPYVPVSLLS